jgi:hypothetical protein
MQTPSQLADQIERIEARPLSRADRDAAQAPLLIQLRAARREESARIASQSRLAAAMRADQRSADASILDRFAGSVLGRGYTSAERAS